jgi:hypothetical protein
MYSELFLAQALLQAVLFVWLWRIWRHQGLLIALVLLVPQFGLVWDNLIVGLGKFIGLGGTLEALSWPRFWLHWFSGTWLIVACGSILRLAGFSFMRYPQAMLAFCAMSVALMIYDLPHFWQDSLHPVCEFDLVRYSTAVAADTFCFEGQQVVTTAPPLPSIFTCLVVILAGAAVMWRHLFPWMFLGGVLMLESAAPPVRALKLDNFGEILIAGGCIWAIARFSRKAN